MVGMQERKSIIHIGLHKTGSTTLQSVLYRLRERLAAQNFFYPGDYLRPGFQHSLLAIYLRESKHDRFKQAMESILGDLARRSNAQLILSGEEFSTLPPQKVEILRTSLGRVKQEFHVVVYIRNLYRFAISQIAQHSKAKKFIAYPASVVQRFQNLDLATMVSAWEKAFGPDHVQVFCLENLPATGNIVSHFADFAGIRLPSELTVVDLNRSADPIASALLSHLVYEFSVPHRVFYNAYFRAARGKAFEVPRTEGHLIELLDDWVRQRNLDHPKLAAHREILLRRPVLGDTSSVNRGFDYLMALSAVLERAAKEMKRCEEQQEPNGEDTPGVNCNRHHS